MPIIFNKYKSFYVANDENSKLNKLGIISNGFDFLKWELSDCVGEDSNENIEKQPDLKLQRRGKRHGKPIPETNSIKNNKTTTEPKKLSKKAKKHRRIAEESSTGDAEISLHVDPPGEEKTRSSKIKLLRELYENCPARVDYYDMTVFKSSFFNLTHDQWLNDDNISLVFEVFDHLQIASFVESHSQLLNSKLGKRFKNSIIFLKPSIAFLLLRFPDPVALKGSLPPLELSSFVFIPLNDNADVEMAEGGSHWSLVVVSMLDGIAYVYDTLGEAGNSAEAQDLIERLNKYMKSLGRFKEIEIKVVDTPQQRNGSDCGVHVLQMSSVLLSRMIYTEDVQISFDMMMDLRAVDGRLFLMKLVGVLDRLTAKVDSEGS